jgi:hypothetical protein
VTQRDEREAAMSLIEKAKQDAKAAEKEHPGIQRLHASADRHMETLAAEGRIDAEGSGAPLPEYRVNAYDGFFGPFRDRDMALVELGQHEADWEENGGPRPPELESRTVGTWQPYAAPDKEEDR